MKYHAGHYHRINENLTLRDACTIILRMLVFNNVARSKFIEEN